jgi:hypothetical protein
MKIKILIAILIIILVSILGFFAYMGAFSRVVIEEKEFGPYTYAYVEHVGPYTGVAEPMMKLYEEMEAVGFNSTNGIGIYYDDPKNTPKEELKSDVGSIVSEEDMDKVDEFSDQFNFAELPQANYLIAEFPIKNVMSYMMGPMKVYPAFAKYLESKNIEVPTKGIEYYDMENNKILYMMEI